MTTITYLKDRIFCKDCLVRAFGRFIIGGFKNAFITDTKSAEILSSMVLLSIGVALLLPAHFSTDEAFSIVLYNTVLQTLPNYSWGLFYLIVGFINLGVTIYGNLQQRRCIALICIYLWLCLIFYLEKYSEVIIDLSIIPYVWLGFTSIFTYLALWRR
jgi:hypothetical protein